MSRWITTQSIKLFMAEHPVFQDTSGIFALLVSNDLHHEKAKVFISKAQKDKLRIVTTGYVLDEAAALL